VLGWNGKLEYILNNPKQPILISSINIDLFSQKGPVAECSCPCLNGTPVELRLRTAAALFHEVPQPWITVYEPRHRYTFQK